jgi:hypothetical protein
MFPDVFQRNACLPEFNCSSFSAVGKGLSTPVLTTGGKMVITGQSNRVVPYHGGGRSKKINAWYLNTHMVYL